MLHRIRIGLFLLLPIVILSGTPGKIPAHTIQNKSSVVKKKQRTVIHRYTVKRKQKKHSKDSLAQGKPRLIRNYPPPGSGGEDRNYDWLRKRAFPNDDLDPSYYPNALEEARKLPVYHPNAKN